VVFGVFFGASVPTGRPAASISKGSKDAMTATVSPDRALGGEPDRHLEEPLGDARATQRLRGVEASGEDLLAGEQIRRCDLALQVLDVIDGTVEHLVRRQLPHRDRVAEVLAAGAPSDAVLDHQHRRQRLGRGCLVMSALHVPDKHDGAEHRQHQRDEYAGESPSHCLLQRSLVVMRRAG
jgi:hypothetical protein